MRAIAARIFFLGNATSGPANTLSQCVVRFDLCFGGENCALARLL